MFVLALPVEVPRRFDSTQPWFPHSVEYFDVHVSSNLPIYRNYVLHVHLITIEVGIVRGGSGSC